MVTTAVTNKGKTYDMAYIGIFAVIIAICSWISIPTVVPFSMQTFGIFLAVDVLGGKRGTIAVWIYVLLGCVGIPVFSGFNAGIGYLMGNTGGYIIGFLAAALVMWGLEKIMGRKTWARAVQMLAGLLTCYVFGTIWFMIMYGRNTGAVGLGTVLGWCVIPFIIPDLIKMGAALVIGKNLSRILHKSM